MATDIPIERHSKSTATGAQADILAANGLDKTTNKNVQVVFNQTAGKFYVVVWDGDTETLHIYKENNALRNKWTEVAAHTGLGNAGINQPIVTSQGTLLIPKQTDGIYRSEDWGETITQVHADEAPHHWKFGEDAVGNIFFGVYRPNTTLKVYKSTDDGQTWALLHEFDSTGAAANTHIHSVAPAPYADIVAVVIGHYTNAEEGAGIGYIKKDGTDPDTEDTPITSGSLQWDASPAIPIRNQSNQDRVPFLVGNDKADSPIPLIRAEASYGGGTAVNHRFNYGLSVYENIQGDVPYITDFDYVNGRIIALGNKGRTLYYTDDGWMWGRTTLSIEPRVSPGFTTTMAVGDRHIAIAGQTIQILPKDVVMDDIKATTYTTFDGTQDTSTHGSRERILRRLPASAVDELRLQYYADDVDATEVEVHLGRMADVYSPSVQRDETIIDTSADEKLTGASGIPGTFLAEVNQHGGIVDLKVTGASDNDRYALTLRRY